MKKVNNNLRWVASMLLVCIGLCVSSCSDDDDVSHSKVALALESPTAISDFHYTNMQVTFTDKSTQEVTKIAYDATSSISTSLVDGIYDIMVEGEGDATVAGQTKHVKVRGELQSVEIADVTDIKTLNIPLHLLDINSGFVLAEIFISGTETPEGEWYRGDSYFRIYNNSSEPLDAQGLILMESALQSDMHKDFYVLSEEKESEEIVAGEGTPYDQYKNDHFITDAVYMIPRGTAVIVEPGQSILLVDIGKDHSVDNPNSFNLTTADYEWYDENDVHADIQTEVPDLVKLYASSASVWSPHVRAIKTYAIAQMPEDVTTESFITNNTVQYYYEFVYGDLRRIMDSKKYFVPTTWIKDCVNLSNETAYEWNIVSTALDNSYAWVYDGTGTGYRGKAVRRKVISGALLQDTNDSAHDFENSVDANPFYVFHAE